MKVIKLILTIFLFLIVGCEQERVIDQAQLQTRNGISYEVNSSSPFTGRGFHNYPSGQKAFEYSYVDGVIDGLVTEWYKNGQKKREGDFVDGKQQGIGTEWHENGQKKREVDFVDGKPQGLATEWYENGQKKSEGNFVDGRLEGTRLQYDKDGRENYSCYKGGKQRTTSKCP